MNRKLKPGDQAPSIVASDIYSNKLSLPDGTFWTYLSFHRFADCPFCTLRTRELIRNQQRFVQEGISIISIWPSEKDVLLRSSAEEKSVLSMIADPGKSLYRKYAVTHSSMMGAVRLLFRPAQILSALKMMKRTIQVDADPLLMPASFLLDPGGKTVMAYYGNHYADHPSIDSILEAKLQAAGKSV